jgi:DNA-binding NarL/FixJ family response regulator
MESISVLLVDDNTTFLRVTKQFLESQDAADMVVIGTASRGEQALEQVEELQPQVILIDLAMPGMPGLDTIPHLRRIMPDVGIVALTMMNTPSFRQAALDAGADAFIPKAAMRTDLLPAIMQIVKGDRKKKVESAAEPILTTKTTTPLRQILIMEDDAHLRRLYSKALRARGYQVQTAATIENARSLLEKSRFDVLLCDIHMGQERGTDLLKEYADTLVTSGTQLVMVSGQARYREMCEELGADFFLEKPISIGVLVALVDRLTARQR